MLTVNGMSTLDSAASDASATRGRLGKGSAYIFEATGGHGIKITNQRAVVTNQVPSPLTAPFIFGLPRDVTAHQSPRFLYQFLLDVPFPCLSQSRATILMSWAPSIPCAEFVAQAPVLFSATATRLFPLAMPFLTFSDDHLMCLCLLWQIFKSKELSFEKLGIGGLDAQFDDIFRRAFASRVFPPDVVEKLGISHVKGMLLYGPPGASSLFPVTTAAAPLTAPERLRPGTVSCHASTCCLLARIALLCSQPSCHAVHSQPCAALPGTGKTLIARQIGKMLNGKEPKVVNGPEILNKYVGQSEENLRNLFADAESEYKAKGEESELHIIIFDEIDAICKQRGSVSSGSGVHDTLGWPCFPPSPSFPPSSPLPPR